MSEVIAACYAIVAHAVNLLSMKQGEYLSLSVIAPKAIAIWVGMLLWYFLLSCFEIKALVATIEPVVPNFLWQNAFVSEFDNMLHISLRTSLPDRIYTTIVLASQAYVRNLPSFCGAFLAFVFLRAVKGA